MEGFASPCSLSLFNDNTSWDPETCISCLGDKDLINHEPCFSGEPRNKKTCPGMCVFYNIEMGCRISLNSLKRYNFPQFHHHRWYSVCGLEGTGLWKQLFSPRQHLASLQNFPNAKWDVLNGNSWPLHDLEEVTVSSLILDWSDGASKTARGDCMGISQQHCPLLTFGPCRFCFELLYLTRMVNYFLKYFPLSLKLGVTGLDIYLGAQLRFLTQDGKMKIFAQLCLFPQQTWEEKKFYID